jgi:hypothetical protein
VTGADLDGMKAAPATLSLDERRRTVGDAEDCGEMAEIITAEFERRRIKL